MRKIVQILELNREVQAVMVEDDGKIVRYLCSILALMEDNDLVFMMFSNDGIVSSPEEHVNLLGFEFDGHELDWEQGRIGYLKNEELIRQRTGAA